MVGGTLTAWLRLGFGLLAIGLVAGCRKPAPTDERKARVELDVWLQPRAVVPEEAIAVAAEPPSTMQTLERAGMRVAIVGVPREGDPIPAFERVVSEAFQAGSNATIVVTQRCLRELVPAMEKHLLTSWTVALVVGAPCEGAVSPALGAALFVEAGSVPRVRITFDRRTRAFLRVEPIR